MSYPPPNGVASIVNNLPKKYGKVENDKLVKRIENFFGSNLGCLVEVWNDLNGVEIAALINRCINCIEEQSCNFFAFVFLGHGFGEGSGFLRGADGQLRNCPKVLFIDACRRPSQLDGNQEHREKYQAPHYDTAYVGLPLPFFKWDFFIGRSTASGCYTILGERSPFFETLIRILEQKHNYEDLFKIFLEVQKEISALPQTENEITGGSASLCLMPEVTSTLRFPLYLRK